MTDTKKEKLTGDALETASALDDLAEVDWRSVWGKYKANLHRKWHDAKSVFNSVKDLGTGLAASLVMGNPVAAVKAGINAIFPGFFGPSNKELTDRIDGLQKGLTFLAEFSGLLRTVFICSNFYSNSINYH